MTSDRNALAEYLRARRELLQPEEVARVPAEACEAVARRPVGARIAGRLPGCARTPRAVVAPAGLRLRPQPRRASRHEARPQVSGTTLAEVAGFGWVAFAWQTLEVPGGDGHFLTTLFGEPGSAAEAVCASLAGAPRAHPPAPPVESNRLSA